MVKAQFITTAIFLFGCVLYLLTGESAQIEAFLTQKTEPKMYVYQCLSYGPGHPMTLKLDSHYHPPCISVLLEISGQQNTISCCR